MMMKIINKINIRSYLLLLVLVLVLPYSCTDKFEEYNTDKSELMEVGPKQLAGLLSNAQSEASSWFNTDNWARMGMQIGLGLSGYVTHTFLPEENNEVRKSWTDTGFNDQYADALPSVAQILAITEYYEGYDAEHAIALIWKVWILHRMTDLWGPIPYTNAASGDETVPYESQRDVYYLMFEDLTSAADALEAVLAEDASANAFGSGDMIYEGDCSKWLKFANSLRLRLAMRISNIEPSKAQVEAEAAVASGQLMSTNDDDALLPVENLKTGNGFCRASSWYSIVMSSSMESVLVGYDDPRLVKFYSPVEWNDVMVEYPDELTANIGGYHGMANGFATETEVGTVYSYSNFAPEFLSDYRYITPLNIMHASETYFLLAEGALKGWDMGGTAKDFYEDGIETSITQWRGTEISTDSIQNYINSENVPIAPNNYGYYDDPMTDIPVKFASNSDDQYEQIMTQKWLALWPLGFEAFAEYRRTRLPKIYAKKYSSNTDVNLAQGQILTRLLYTDKEYAAQPEEVEKGINLLYNGTGEDIVNVPLWWDVNPN
jgi:hypothetical protein